LRNTRDSSGAAENREQEPSRFLVDNMALLPRGKALDVAMGVGRNSLYLARQGFKVEGVDISDEAVHQALQQAEIEGLTIKAQVGDLEKDYTISVQTYDLILCFNYLQRSLIPQIKDGIIKGGLLVYETFIIDQAELFGRPRNPAFLLKHNELLEMFRDFRVLLYREGIVDNIRAVASLIAQKG
jgi:tellurite methyltransferase